MSFVNFAKIFFTFWNPPPPPSIGQDHSPSPPPPNRREIAHCASWSSAVPLQRVRTALQYNSTTQFSSCGQTVPETHEGLKYLWTSNMSFNIQDSRPKINSSEGLYLSLESIEWFIEHQAFSPSYDWASPPPSWTCDTCRKTEKEKHLADGRWGRGWRSQIIRRRESLVMCKSFHTLCLSLIIEETCK